ncbi:DUF1365 domain-containing protein [Allokutzneria albata]|uniref:DUF1365 domain-containing protein n=1 Tax=Allokutzneria albata TaxID=211114 RepID=A0A1H0DPR3_ALLAB|nr:DUF1365 domain-containing protein [Allokutzneria albata]SDN72145.1 hypothetical protein SAMN04489726_7922 [Allokutzneria albata]
MIYDAVVTHTRLSQIRRRFSHRVHMWLVDLDALPRGFEARDHLGDPGRSIRENLDSWLASQGIDLRGGRVLMLANARMLGYVFNPLSVFWCHTPDGELECIVAEVHNTYGGRHCYLLRPDRDGRADADKEFYVSPFFTVDGRYDMRFSRTDERLDISISLRQNDEVVFVATLRGQRSTRRRRLLMLPQRVSALIFRHGIALWLRRLPVIPREEGVQ